MLNKFFNANSIAIVGVSNKPNKIGHVIFSNLINFNYRGKLYPVNPKYNSLMNHEVYSSLTKIKNKIDLVVIAVPAKYVLNILKDCNTKKIKHVILITAGFKEIGNIKLDTKVKDYANKHNIKIIGPNCLGTFDSHNHIDTLFIPKSKMKRPQPGYISFVCQSGAVGSALLDYGSEKGIKFSKFISYGNAMNIDESDLIEYLNKDKFTKIICVYLEGLKDGKKFMDVCKKTKKPIIVLKGGITSEGNTATMSHTGSLAGNIKVYKGAFKQVKVIYADTLKEMFNYAKILEKSIPPKGNKIQIITNGGGYGVLSTDSIISSGLKLAKISEKTKKILKKQMPPTVSLNNPIDLVGDADTKRYTLAVKACLNDKDIDIIHLILLPQTPKITTDIIDSIIELNKENKKPIIITSTGGDFTQIINSRLEEGGIPVFEFPDEAVKSEKVLYEFYNN